MKGSEINGLIEEAIRYFQEKQFYLPPNVITHFMAGVKQ